MRGNAVLRATWKLAAILALAGCLSAAGAALAGARAASPPAGRTPPPPQAEGDGGGALGPCAPLPDGTFAFASPRGVVWVSPAGRVTGTTGVAEGLPGARAEDLALRDGELWVATEGGLARVVSGAAPAVEPAAEPAAGPSAGSGAGPSAWRVAHVVPTGPATAVAANEVWVYVGVRDRGVVRVDPRSLQVKPLPFAAPALGLEATGRARVTALDTGGECDGADLLVGTAGAGVYRDVDEELVREPGFPRTTWAWDVVSGDAGGAVAAVAGLLRFGHEAPLSRRDLRALARDARGRLVAGGPDGGIFAVREASRGAAELERLEQLPDGAGQVVTSLRYGPRGACAASAGAAWVRPRGGAWRRVRRTTRPPADLSAVAVGPDGAVWVAGFRGGLWVRRGGRWRRVGAGRVDPWVNGLAVTRDGAAWAATARGLFRVAPDGTTRRFGVQDGLPSENLHTVLALRGGGVAVGGTRGLARVTARGRVVAVGTKQGLAARGVWALAERPAAAGGGLVVGTTEGVWLEEAAGRWERLSVASGHLPDDFVTAVALSGDGRTLWAGTYQGGVARVELETRAARQLGGGRVNVAGLVWLPGRGASGRPALLAATMGGLLRRVAAGDAMTGDAMTGDAMTRAGGGWTQIRRLLRDSALGPPLGRRRAARLGARRDGATPPRPAACLLAQLPPPAPRSSNQAADLGWTTVPGLPGLDVTGVAVAGDALWVSTRRGVARLPRRAAR